MRVIPEALASITAPSLFLLASCASSGPGPAYRAVEANAAPAPSARLAAYEPVAALPAAVLTVTDPQDRYGDRDSRSRSSARNDFDSSRGQYSPPPTGRFSILLGGRSVDDDFEPTDTPGAIGFEFSQVPSLGGLGFEFGLGFAADQKDDVNVPGVGIADLDLTQAEIYAGARAEFGSGGALRPYIGGGGVFLSTRTTLEQGFLEAEEDDTIFGGYVHGGLQGDLTETVFIGVDFRHVFAGDYDINGVDIPADYSQIAFTIGFNL